MLILFNSLLLYTILLLFILFILFIFFISKNKQKIFSFIVTDLFYSISSSYFYFYYIFLNSNFSNTVINYSQINFYSNSLIILSILLFYLFPFIFLQRSPFLTYLRENKKFIIIIFLIFLILYLIDQFLNFNLINFSPKGGGVFVKIANIFNINQLLVLSITSYLSLITLDYFFKEKDYKTIAY